MRVLMLNSPWVNTENEYCVKAGTRWAAVRRKDRSLQYFPFPYFMASTVAFLREAGFDASMRDAVADELSREESLARDEALAPDLIVIEAFTPSIEVDLEYARAAKARTGARIAFCGAHPTALPEAMLEDGAVDYVLLEEYDFPLRDLCRALEDGEPGADALRAVKGLCFRNASGEAERTPRRTDTFDYDEMPLPVYDGLPMLKYTEPLSRFYPTARVVTSRGCPHNCSFCIEPLVAGRNYRRRSIDKVVAEIRGLQERFGVREIYFDDAILTIPRTKEIARGLIEHGLDIAWTAWVDWRIRYDDLQLLAESGCVGIKFGVESASDLVRESVGKGKLVQVEKIRRAVANCKELGVFAHGSFLAGGPGETKRSLQDTIDLCFDLGLDSSQWSIATPLPGTPFYRQAVEEGWLVSDRWADYDPLNACVLQYEECGPADIVAGLDQVRRRKAQQFLGDPRRALGYLWKSYRMMGPKRFTLDVLKKARFVASSVTSQRRASAPPR